MNIKIFVELRVKIIPIKYITLKKKKISFEEIKTSRSIASGIRTRIIRPNTIQSIYRLFLSKILRFFFDIFST